MVSAGAGVEVVTVEDETFDEILVDEMVVVATDVETPSNVEEASDTLSLTVTATLVNLVVGEVVVKFVEWEGSFVVASDTEGLDPVSDSLR